MSAQAPSGSIQTAVDIPLEHDRPVQVGRCIVTTVYLESERPRGRIRHRPIKVVEAETGDGAVVDSAELQQLAALGLPTSFASSQAPAASSQQQQQQQRLPWQQPARGKLAANGSAGASWTGGQPSQWLQAYDPDSKRRYYVHPVSRRPQWEAPPGGEAACLPPPFAWSEALWALQDAAAGSSGAGGSAAAAGVDGSSSSAAAVPGGGSPAAAVADSSQLHMQSRPPVTAAAQPVTAVSSATAPAVDTAEPPSAPAMTMDQFSQQLSGAGSNQHPEAAAASERVGSNSSASGSEPQPQAAATAGEWVRGPLPRKLWKYWMQRYTLFVRFGDGILLDEEGWFSVTPEAIARHHAQRCACNTVLDPFAGVGGNVIQMAATCRHVIAGELSPDRASLIRHNAQVYGVADRIEVRCSDFWDASASAQADVVFLSPPWGGPQYLSQPVFSVHPRLGSMAASLGDLLRQARKAHRHPRGGAASGSGSGSGSGSASGSHTARAVAQASQPSPSQQHSPAQQATVSQQQTDSDLKQSPIQSRRGVVVFLPKNTDLWQLSDLTPPGKAVEVERNILDGFFKGITVYFWEE